MALQNTSDVETAWLAGLFEGEATFGYAGTRRGTPAVRITLAMTDKDVIQKAHSLLGVGSFNPNKAKLSAKFPNAKPLYVYTIAAQNDCLTLMQRILPHMGIRRSERLQELISYIQSHPSKWNRGEGGAHGSSRRCRTCSCDICVAEKDQLRERARAYETERRRNNA